MNATTRCHPADLVRTAPLAALLHAWGGAHWFGIVDDDAGLRIICPRCGEAGMNGPTAHVISASRISCTKCRRAFTRALLERLITEDADLLEAFLAELEVTS